MRQQELHPFACPPPQRRRAISTASGLCRLTIIPRSFMPGPPFRVRWDRGKGGTSAAVLAGDFGTSGSRADPRLFWYFPLCRGRIPAMVW